MQQTETNYFWTGARDVLPFLLGGFPFGILVGVLARQVAVPVGLAISQSVIVFAGTAQLAALDLIGESSPVWIILVTTIFINIRMMMYSVTISPYFRETARPWQVLIAYLLTDQAFAFSSIFFENHPDLTETERRHYYLGISVPVWLMWIVATIIGAFLGSSIPAEWGIDFVVPLAFIALIVPNIKTTPTFVAAAVAALSAAALAGIPLNMGLLISIVIGMVAGRLSEVIWPLKPDTEEGGRNE